MIKNLIDKYTNVEYMTTRGLEAHPNASGTEYLQGKAQAYREIIEDLQSITATTPAELLEAGERVFSVDPYEARNNDQTPETLAQAIITNPVGIINFLCDIIDDLQA